jgi:hypothetical protein
MMAIMVVVLIGIAALAVDVGRVLVLRTEVQNAVDAAALAAAVELNGKDGARARAMAAARHALSHDSKFARIQELLGDASLPDAAFNFFCIIGSQMDVNPDDVDMTEFCNGADLGDGSWSAGADADAHYVRVTLHPDTAGDHVTVDLFFLPVLRVFGMDPMTFVSVTAAATAGRHFYTCNYPPMALCDPFEGSGTDFRTAMTPGAAIQLRQQGSNQWTHGNFGFLEPRDGGPGAPDVAEYLADEGLTGCTPPIVTTKTGSMTNKTTSAVNTRFDVYDNPAPFNKPNAWRDWPPAPNVIDYPLDSVWNVSDPRFGTGQWDFETYWAANHSGMPAPEGWNNSTNRPSRWAVYNWEIANNAVPAAGQPNPAHVYTGDYPPPRSIPERRLLYVAVLSCNALGLTGGKATAAIFQPDGFAKMFLVRKAEGPPNAVMYAEYVGWAEETDANFHVDIQLYQ